MLQAAFPDTTDPSVGGVPGRFISAEKEKLYTSRGRMTDEPRIIVTGWPAKVANGILPIICIRAQILS